jgi:phage baseplate assembly protein W
MSFDFQLGWACRHLTIEEVVPLGDDRRSLQTRQPISSANQVRITANNNVNVPREGRFAPASLSSSISGPYSIDKCARSITISNRTQTLENFQLPIGLRVDTSQLVRVLERGLRDAGVQISVRSRDGVLQFTDQLELGPSSRIQVSGDAAKSLGLTFQTRARGRQVYPAWDMAERATVTNLVNINQFKTVTVRYPQFKSPVKGNPVFKVTYATYIQRCLRCRASGIENDIRLATSGEPIVVRNEDLLNQAVLKMVITRKGSNPFHPVLGTTLLDRIGMKAVGAVQMSVNEDVTRAVTLFQRLQTAQAKVQQVTLKERLYNILSVKTVPAENDPTVFQTNIIAQNASGEPVFISTVFAAPGAAALVGTNGLSLGLAPLGIPGF